MSKLSDYVSKSKEPTTPNTKLDIEKAKAEVAHTLSEVAQGKKGKPAKLGSIFEKELEQTIHIYEDLHIAYIQKFFPKSTFIPPRNGKPGFMLYTAKTGFDYIGGLIHENIPIFIEAKSTNDSRLEVGAEKTGIKAHQLAKMLWMENNTSFMVFFLWQIRSADAIVYKFTPNQLMEAIGDKKSVTIVNCEEARFSKMIKTKFQNEMVYDFLYKLEGLNQ